MFGGKHRVEAVVINCRTDLIFNGKRHTRARQWRELSPAERWFKQQVGGLFVERHRTCQWNVGQPGCSWILVQSSPVWQSLATINWLWQRMDLVWVWWTMYMPKRKLKPEYVNKIQRQLAFNGSLGRYFRQCANQTTKVWKKAEEIFFGNDAEKSVLPNLFSTWIWFSETHGQLCQVQTETLQSRKRRWKGRCGGTAWPFHEGNPNDRFGWSVPQQISEQQVRMSRFDFSTLGSLQNSSGSHRKLPLGHLKGLYRIQTTGKHHASWLHVQICMKF